MHPEELGEKCVLPSEAFIYVKQRRPALEFILACGKPLEVVQVHASVSPVSSGAAVSNFMSCHRQLQGFFFGR